MLLAVFSDAVELRPAQGFGLRVPLRQVNEEVGHELSGFIVGDLPQGGHDRLSPRQLKRLPQASHSFSRADVAEARLARAQDHH